MSKRAGSGGKQRLPLFSRPALDRGIRRVWGVGAGRSLNNQLLSTLTPAPKQPPEAACTAPLALPPFSSFAEERGRKPAGRPETAHSLRRLRFPWVREEGFGKAAFSFTFIIHVEIRPFIYFIFLKKDLYLASLNGQMGRRGANSAHEARKYRPSQPSKAHSALTRSGRATSLPARSTTAAQLSHSGSLRPDSS